jgi:hypothetical protein
MTTTTRSMTVESVELCLLLLIVPVLLLAGWRVLAGDVITGALLREPVRGGAGPGGRRSAGHRLYARADRTGGDCGTAVQGDSFLEGGMGVLGGVLKVVVMMMMMAAAAPLTTDYMCQVGVWGREG